MTGMFLEKHIFVHDFQAKSPPIELVMAQGASKR
jgi:hypothetical protein